MKNILEVKNLSKSYKNLKAVDNLSFELKEGEILGLLGPKGSGKTTTINSILGLLKIDKGDILIFGKKLSLDSYDIKEKMGVVFQDIAVFNELTVYQNVDYFCGLYIFDKNKRKKAVDDVINLTGLNEFTKYYPNKLSGGLLRRLNIACGIAHKPKLIFLDEPTVAVDPQSRNNILDGIKKLKENGASIIYTTHYMEEAEILCDRIIILDKGKIIANGSLDELKKISSIEEKITVELVKYDKEKLNNLNKLSNISGYSFLNNTLYITYLKGNNNLENLITFLKRNNIVYNKIFSERPTLNDVFLELTGKDLRD